MANTTTTTGVGSHMAGAYTWLLGEQHGVLEMGSQMAGVYTWLLGEQHGVLGV